MLIQGHEVLAALQKHNIPIKGVFHIGAHECEELSVYTAWGLTPGDVLWIDALQTKVTEAKARGIPNVYHALITDNDGHLVTFHVANNGQSSSVLEFGTHSQEHPSIVYVRDVEQKTMTIDTFFERNGIDPSRYTVWNMDIQGAELMAIRGAPKAIRFARALYLEVNEKELYKGCGLIGDIDDVLSTYGFTRILTSMTDHGWGDALYVNSTGGT